MVSDRSRTVLLVQDCLTYLAGLKALTPRTIALYERLCTSLVDECVAERGLEAVTTAAIEAWLQRPRDGRARGRAGAPATLHRDASAIRGLFRWLQAQGVVRENPAELVCTPVVHNRQPRPVPDAVFCRLWGTVDRADAVVLGLAFFGGLRREEITRLRVSNVDVGRRRLVNFMRKGGGEDTLPVGTMLDTFAQRLPHLSAERLWPIIAARANSGSLDRFLVGWSELGLPRRTAAAARRGADQLDPQHLNHWLDRMTSRADVPHLAPHQLRHSCATNLLRAGVPLPIASNLMNHSNVHTTMRYMKAGGDELAEWLARTTPLEALVGTGCLAAPMRAA
jgi:site-specific recombinase XerD